VILVDGATRRTGGTAVRALRRTGRDVRALVRDQKEVDALRSAGVWVVEGDLACHRVGVGKRAPFSGLRGCSPHVWQLHL